VSDGAPYDNLPAVRIVVTGGAGFVGSSLALDLRRRHPDWEIVAADSLFRRGSELNLPRLKEAGVEFVHADVRHPEDLVRVGDFTALIECSAEPSVMAAVQGEGDFVVNTNLMGAYHCLDLAARQQAQVIFLSTSRVYPVAGLEALVTREEDTRFVLTDEQPLPGASSEGISEDFPLKGARTLYGATKLSGELLCEEYAETFGIPITVNRCGVIAGPWQMGKVDQGVFTHWLLSHHTGRDLKYIGYGGTGKQVRDLVHIDDLNDLVDDQLTRPEHWAGRTFNVGGGEQGSLSLLETTELCREITGREVSVTAAGESRPGDVRVYLTDTRAVREHGGWAPTRTPRDILTDIYTWVTEHEALVLGALS
jgi:CDP-paratose 2-epimerase